MIKSRVDKFFRWLRIRKIKKYVPKDAIVLDIGCGNPPLALFCLRDKIKKGIGIDRQFEGKKWDSKIKTEQLDLDDFLGVSFSDNRPDCILMLAVLEHIQDPLKVLIIIKRILKDNGLFILTTPTPRAKPVLEFLSFRLGLVSKQEMAEHKHYFSKKEILSILNKFGFSDIKHSFFELGFNQIVVARK